MVDFKKARKELIELNMLIKRIKTEQDLCIVHRLIEGATKKQLEAIVKRTVLAGGLPS